jgi:hypothetical protein
MVPFSPLAESRTDICWRVGIIYNTGWVEVPLRFSFGGGWLEVGGCGEECGRKGGWERGVRIKSRRSSLLAWMAHVSPTQNDVGCCGDRTPTITRSCVTHVQTRLCPIVAITTLNITQSMKEFNPTLKLERKQKLETMQYAMYN